MATGEYRIGNLPEGEYNVTASKEGYDTQTKVAVVKTGEVRTDFQLSEIVVEMPNQVSVTATPDIPLWYFDDVGSAKIPCTRDNPVKNGVRFKIAVSEGGESETIIAAPLWTKPEETKAAISIDLKFAPEHLRGVYKGNIVINGSAGTIHVILTEYPKIGTKKVKISCDQDASIYVNGELKHTPTIGRLTKVLRELR